ncbi:MAG: hypothetical protein H0X30_05565 [Anaerolineae bacterium]|nr:hypothetical protein [Anaerolineae bacterium]
MENTEQIRKQFAIAQVGIQGNYVISGLGIGQHFTEIGKLDNKDLPTVKEYINAMEAQGWEYVGQPITRDTRPTALDDIARDGVVMNFREKPQQTSFVDGVLTSINTGRNGQPVEPEVISTDGARTPAPFRF